MKDLFIEKTKETPEINFNYKTGTLYITGRAYSNDIYQLFKPLNSWLEEYITKPKELTIIELKIEYCNSIFNKLLIIFLENSKKVELKQKNLTIKWHYEKTDKDSLDEAHHVSRLINFPIETIEF